MSLQGSFPVQAPIPNSEHSSVIMEKSFVTPGYFVVFTVFLM